MVCFQRNLNGNNCKQFIATLHEENEVVSVSKDLLHFSTWAGALPRSVGQTSQWSIRSPCSALSSVALAKCQCWDCGLLILLLNVAALSGKKKAGLICEQSAASESEGAVWTQLCRDMSHWPPPWSPRTLWSLRMALDYISGTATLYEVFLRNSLYCLTTSTWAQRLSCGGGRVGVPPGVKVCGIGETWLESWTLFFFLSLSSTHLSFKGFEAADPLSL